ncbi:hypothetical protein H257_18227, partial [Aphanomyces astaci]
ASLVRLDEVPTPGCRRQLRALLAGVLASRISLDAGTIKVQLEGRRLLTLGLQLVLQRRDECPKGSLRRVDSLETLGPPHDFVANNRQLATQLTNGLRRATSLGVQLVPEGGHVRLCRNTGVALDDQVGLALHQVALHSGQEFLGGLFGRDKFLDKPKKIQHLYLSESGTWTATAARALSRLANNKAHSEADRVNDAHNDSTAGAHWHQKEQEGWKPERWTAGLPRPTTILTAPEMSGMRLMLERRTRPVEQELVAWTWRMRKCNEDGLGPDPPAALSLVEENPGQRCSQGYLLCPITSDLGTGATQGAPGLAHPIDQLHRLYAP